MTKLSIIIPIYNLEEYLPRCLDSLTAQTLKDIEIICVNDESTDNSLAVLKDYAQKDRRIKIINQKNAGPGVARNAGIDAAKGEYIQFVDGDDWIEPDTCEKCYQKAKQSGVDMLTFNAEHIYPDRKITYHYYNLKEEKIISYTDILDSLFEHPFHSWHYIFRKSFLDKKGIRFPAFFQSEDAPFVLEALLKSNSIYSEPSTFYKYVRRENSITKLSKFSFDAFTVIPLLEKIVAEHPLLKDQLSKWKINHLFYSFKKGSSTLEQKKFKELAKKFCTSSEYKKFLRRIRQPITASYKLKLFNFIPVFSYKERGTTKRCKIFGLPILKIKKIGNKRRYFVCGLPILKSKEDRLFNRKNYFLCGLPILTIKTNKKIKKKYILLKQQYQKTLSRLQEKIKNGEKIRVGFYVNDSKFKTENIFNLMTNSSIYEPFILVGKNNAAPDQTEYQTKDEIQNIKQYFENKNMTTYLAFDFDRNTPICLSEFSPDIIFYSRPYYIFKEHQIESVSEYALPVYVPYFVPNSPENVEAGMPFHSLLWKYFVLNSIIRKNYAPVMANQGDNLCEAGHPILDTYLSKAETDGKNYVIYAPHWSIGNTLLNYATFDWNGQYILDFAKKHPEFNWIFKPHPILYNQLISSGYMTKQDTDNYYQEWKKIATYYNGPDYFDLFKSSSALITDCGSFLIEYFPTKNPVVLMRSKKATPYTTLAKKITNTYYQAYDLKTLEKHLSDVLLGKKDSMKQRRVYLLNKLNLIQNASQNIIDILNKELNVK